MLINDVPQLKAILGGIQKEMYWATWEPYVRQSEMKYIIPAIGEDLHEELVNVTQPTADQLPVLARLRSAVAYFAYMEALPFLVTATGDAGLLINAPTNTSNISKWLYVTINKEVAAKSDFWLEDALAWLERHAAAFPAWTQSDAYTINHGRLIASASQLTTAFPSAKNSRRLFVEIRQYLFNAEDEFIRPILGDDFHEAIMTRLSAANNTFTVKELNVLRLCRLALANHAFMKALPFLNLNVDYRYVSETDGIVNEDELDTNRLNIILKSCRDMADGKVAELTKYLNANASSLIFPEYFASDRYLPTTSGGSGLYDNQSSNTFFVL